MQDKDQQSKEAAESSNEHGRTSPPQEPNRQHGDQPLSIGNDVPTRENNTIQLDASTPKQEDREDNHYASELGKSLRRNIGDFFERMKPKRSFSLRNDKPSQLKESFLELLAPGEQRTDNTDSRDQYRDDGPQLRRKQQEHSAVRRVEETKDGTRFHRSHRSEGDKYDMFAQQDGDGQSRGDKAGFFGQLYDKIKGELFDAEQDNQQGNPQQRSKKQQDQLVQRERETVMIETGNFGGVGASPGKSYKQINSNCRMNLEGMNDGTNEEKHFSINSNEVATEDVAATVSAITTTEAEVDMLENSGGRKSLDGQSEATKLNKEDSYEAFKKGAGNLAGRAKDYATEVSEKITEGVEEMRCKMKAYIGPIEEAEDFTVDNQFIIQGYRINHTSAKSLCKSLFSCHNEFVNVWSHIGGVVIFLCLLITLCVEVIPSQFQYAYQLTDDYSDLGNGANPEDFINSKITDLQVLQDQTLLSKMSSDDFSDNMTEIMYRIEGISHFTIEQFYGYDYLKQYSDESDPTLDTLVDTWYSTITGYNNQMLTQLAKSQAKISSAGSKVEIKKFTNARYNFLGTRLTDLNVSLSDLNTAMLAAVSTADPSKSDLAHKTDYLNNLEESTAPDFLDANEILNEVPIWPLIINILSACFCMGCSAFYHLISVKNPFCQQNFSRLDYGGISVLIFGSTFPLLYYGFACPQVLVVRNIYGAFLGCSCAACFVVTLIPKFDQQEYRKVRGIMYIILGLSTALLFAVFTFYEDYVTLYRPWLYALGGYIYIQGAIIYMIRCPERCKPGTFDFCGASHQIFHFAVVSAALLHYSLNYKVFRNRQEMECPIWEQ